MADDKRGREKQAADTEKRQIAREIATELTRGDEPEPPVDAEVLADIEAALDTVAFPATGAEIVAAAGERTVTTATESYRVAELIPETNAETFDSPRAVSGRLQRPAVAAAIKRIVDASRALPNRDRLGSQRDAYLRTFQELAAIDAVDDDEVVRAIADWIVDRIEETDALPGSRAVRKQAAAVCRANGYQVRDSDWLGV